MDEPTLHHQRYVNFFKRRSPLFMAAQEQNDVPRIRGKIAPLGQVWQFLEPTTSTCCTSTPPPTPTPLRWKQHSIACRRTQGNIQYWFGSATVQQSRTRDERCPFAHDTGALGS